MHQNRFVIVLIVLFLSVSGFAQNSNEDFFAAARRGDAAAVKAFLDKGVDVNAKTQYGATALSYASDKGHTEVVRLLLERGADPNVRDTFYGATPMSWAAPKGHVEVVRLLIEKGSKDKGEALKLGVDKGAVELVKAVLAKGEVPAATLTKALSKAEAQNRTEIADLLKKAGAAPFQKVGDEVLKTYVGVYKNDPVGTLTLSLKDGKFIGQIGGQQTFTLGALSETSFTIIEIDGATFTFSKEGDKVTGVSLRQGGGNFLFKRAE